MENSISHSKLQAYKATISPYLRNSLSSWWASLTADPKLPSALLRSIDLLGVESWGGATESAQHCTVWLGESLASYDITEWLAWQMVVSVPTRQMVVISSSAPSAFFKGSGILVYVSVGSPASFPGSCPAFLCLLKMTWVWEWGYRKPLRMKENLVWIYVACSKGAILWRSHS